jgi:hypothetical protein
MVNLESGPSATAIDRQLPVRTGIAGDGVILMPFLLFSELITRFINTRINP